ncbi:MAG: hypothetical protein OXH92_08290 [Bryobacterales bacterium]|nr:hypothetical protein [Bryobacterales bacterium]
MLKGMKQLLVASTLLMAIFSSSALASERSVADELLALEKYRYDESEDVTKQGVYRSGNMNRKMLHLAWEIIREVKGEKADELLELGKFRYSESEDISSQGIYRRGNMNRKTLHLIWEILKEVKMNREARMTSCRDTTASGEGGT